MTTIIAHRGARSIAPENTIAAAAKALESGADLWETDVVATKDEHLILFHDESLERTTDVKKVFPANHNLTYTEYTLEQIKMLNTGTRYIETDPFNEIEKGNLTKEDLLAFKREKIPTLEEAILFTKEKHWKVNLELKRLPGKFKDFPLPEKVIKMIQKTGINHDQVIISSFHHQWLNNIHYMEPKIEIQALIGGFGIDHLDWGNFSFKTYNANSNLIDKQQINTAKKKGKKINLFIVNSTEEMKKFIEQGVDGIITDYPQRLKSLENCNYFAKSNSN